MALYIHGPLRCKNLLGRIPNPHSRHALAVPQHAPGPRSDARSQRTPPGEIMHRSAAPHPAAAPAAKCPSPPARPRSDRPAASRTHAAHTHTAQIRHPAAHAGSCATPAAPHDQPPDSTKARPTIKPDRLFLLHDGTGHRPAETIGKNHTARPPPTLPAASIFRRENLMQATASHDTGRHSMAPDAKRFHIVPNNRSDSRSSMLHPAAPPPTLGPLAKWSAPWFNAGTQRTTHIDQQEKRCIV